MTEELEQWKQEFTEINKKIKSAWGAAVEGDGLGGERIRIYVSDEESKQKALDCIQKENRLSDWTIEFTIADQEEYQKWKNEKENGDDDDQPSDER